MNKSSLLTIANRLTKTMDRRAAFRQAWQIAKAGGLMLPVKGVKFSNRQEALKRLAVYAPEQIRAFIVPEQDNPVDGKALSVMVGVQNGKGLFKLGYIPADKIDIVNALVPIHAPALKVVSGTWGWAGKTTYGARVSFGA
jgi:uncharacterized protein YkuJ